MNMVHQSDWQARAITAYHHRHEYEARDLQADMVDRLDRLTGSRIAPHTIYVNRDERRATVVVDGVIFRLRQQDLVMVRACVVCGVAQFESVVLADAADVGYALNAWQPRCRHCAPADPAD